MCYALGGTYWQYVFHRNHEHVVGNQPVPIAQDTLDGFQQQIAPKEQKIETGHQVTHAEDADPGCPRDEYDS